MFFVKWPLQRIKIITSIVVIIVRLTKMIYVAERANGGGRVLTFSVPTTSGDYAPVMNRLEPGCAAVFLQRR